MRRLPDPGASPAGGYRRFFTPDPVPSVHRGLDPLFPARAHPPPAPRQPPAGPAATPPNPEPGRPRPLRPGETSIFANHGQCSLPRPSDDVDEAAVAGAGAGGPPASPLRPGFAIYTLLGLGRGVSSTCWPSMWFGNRYQNPVSPCTPPPSVCIGVPVRRPFSENSLTISMPPRPAPLRLAESGPPTWPIFEPAACLWCWPPNGYRAGSPSGQVAAVQAAPGPRDGVSP